MGSEIFKTYLLSSGLQKLFEILVGIDFDLAGYIWPLGRKGIASHYTEHLWLLFAPFVATFLPHHIMSVVTSSVFCL